MNFPGSGSSSAPGAVSLPTAIRALQTALVSGPVETSGTTVGNYRLLEKIGEGGFGEVWMAEQKQPIRRYVALKIIKAGMDTEEVIARFAAERQALALMDHPNIARVFDAGTTESGRLFFVMELVRGVPIMRYCDENQIAPEPRLRLFMSVCHAVQHAHQKGIIHRDLKPSNILVTLHDGVPVPKIIDFGIAKATGGPLTEQTLFTRFHAFMGTPAYTSPEQMEMSGLDVDTRSDVYSLGVLLYELLAGRPPFDPEALVRSGLEAMRRTIREIDPPRPSARLGTLSAADRNTVAQQRGTDPARLSILIRGDLDWVVMRCLEKDRRRRYDTASALAQDVERHLRNEPITARPAGVVYRAKKFVRRHAIGFAAAVVIAISLVGGLFTTSLLLVRERVAHERASSAERAEKKLREEVEVARHVEAVQASQTSLALAERLFGDRDSSAALAQLVHAARRDPGNSGIGPRLLSALAYRNYLLPVPRPIRHPGVICGAALTATGQVFTLGMDGVGRVWDAEHGQPQRTWRVDPVNRIALSSDRRRIGVRHHDGTAAVIEIDTGRTVFRVNEGHEFSARSGIKFSGDDRFLFAAGDSSVHVWDAFSGDLIISLRHEPRVEFLAVSPDGRCVCTVTRREWRTWRIPTGELLGAVSTEDPGRALTFAAFSPDSVMLAIGDPRGAQFHDPVTGRQVGERMQHPLDYRPLLFSHDGRKLVTCSTEGSVRMWAVPSGQPLGEPMLHHHGVGPTLFTPDDRHLITSSEDGFLRVWDAQTGRLACEPARAPFGAIDVAGGEIMQSGPDDVVRRWRMSEGVQPLLFSPDPRKARLLVNLRGDSPTAWAVCKDRIQAFDWRRGEVIGEPRRLPVAIDQPAIAPNRQFLRVAIDDGAAGARPPEYELWDLRAPHIVRYPLGRYASIGPSSFSEDSSLLAVFDDGKSVLRVFETETGALKLGPIANASLWYSFSPGGRHFAVTLGSSPTNLGQAVHIYDIGTGRRTAAIEQMGLEHVVFSPDARWIAACGPRGTALWETHTGKLVRQLPMVRPINSVFARQSARLVARTWSEARVWDVRSGAALTPPMPAGPLLGHVAFSGDESRIATWAMADGTMRIWDGSSGQLIADIRLPEASGTKLMLGFMLSDRFVRLAGGGFSIVHAVPPDAHAGPLPGWLLRLATVMAGGDVDPRGVFREQPVEMRTLDEIRRELAALPDDAPYVEWGRWLVGDPATRPLAPGFAMTRSEAQQFVARLDRLGRD